MTSETDTFTPLSIHKTWPKCEYCKEVFGLFESAHLCMPKIVHFLIDHLRKNPENAAKLREALKEGGNDDP